MADISTTTIRASFATREAAELAIEHLVQQYGVSRPDIFVQAVGEQNTAGTAASGGDVDRPDGARDDAALQGEIEVSVEITTNQIPAVQRSFGDAGATRVSGR
jgi:hypothetical protein